MNIKERRTKILLALYFLSNVNREGDRVVFSSVTLDSQAQDIFDLPLNRKTTSSLRELKDEGLIESTDPSTSLKYKLTLKGFHALALRFPYVRFFVEAWDGVWRILSYEIPEKKRELRDRLRREVAGWGLGPWHRSFWLTPHPIITNLKQLVNGREEEKYIQAFEAQHLFGDSEVLIEKVWGKSSLEARYRELFKKWHKVLSTDNEKSAKLKEIIKYYIEVIREDPGLPEGLIGTKWIGKEAFTIFSEIRSILLV